MLPVLLFHVLRHVLLPRALGAHARDDYNEGPMGGRDDENWRVHTISRLNEAEGTVDLSYRPVKLDPLTPEAEGGIDMKKIAPKARVY